MNNFFFPYFGPLIVKTFITKEQIKDIKKLCNKKTSYHNNLAGHIKDEYLINFTKYNTIIQPQLKTFKEVYKNFYAKELESIEIKLRFALRSISSKFSPPLFHLFNQRI